MHWHCADRSAYDVKLSWEWLESRQLFVPLNCFRVTLMSYANQMHWRCISNKPIIFTITRNFQSHVLDQRFPTTILETPQHCMFPMSPYSNTPDSDHQLITKDSKTWIGCQTKERCKVCSVGGPPGSWLGTTVLDSARNGHFRSSIGHPWLRQKFLFPIYLQLGKSVLLPEGHLLAEFSSHPH